MRVIFDLGHPAHYHLFKYVISTLIDSGHDVELIARQKDCLADLLEEHKWPYHLIGRKGNGLSALGWQNLRAFRTAVSLAKTKRTDFMIGTSIIIGPASRLSGATSLIFGEDDAKAVPIFAKLAYPIVHYIVTPECLKFENYGKKHLTYPGYHELAYLHPNRYKPDPGIRELLGLNPNERYFLIRLVSLTAHHDIGKKGLSTAQAQILIEHLSKYGRVFISAEKVVDKTLEPHLLPVSPERIFDVMWSADMFIGDSQTMCCEAAVLGTPALRCNSFVGHLAYLEELEHKYGLTIGFRPENFDRLLSQVNEWLSRPDIKKQWQQKREVMLNECVDLTDWIIKTLYNLAGDSR
jgi:predicted glycosyltransferase